MSAPSRRGRSPDHDHPQAAAIGSLPLMETVKIDEDLETLRGLVRETDVFSQGYRPGTLGDRGFSPEALAQLRPGIVFVTLCAFSHVGPWASRRGFDTVVQTVSGIPAVRESCSPARRRARSSIRCRRSTI